MSITDCQRRKKEKKLGKESLEAMDQTDCEGIRKGKWSPDEDELLCILVKQYEGKNWKKIAQQIKGRKAIQCLHRWSKILQPGLVKGPWTLKEDNKLIQWVERNGPTKWALCAETIKGRSGKQCREHWNNSLCPNVKKGMWSIEEDFLILFYYERFKGSWKQISPFFEGRTENSIKNRFFSQLRKIAGNSNNSTEKRATAKIKLITLLNYIPQALLMSMKQLKSYLNISNEEFEAYLQGLEDRLKMRDCLSRSVSEGLNDKTKDGSIKEDKQLDIDISQIERNQIEAMDIETLEKEIYNQCDNGVFFKRNEAEFDFENNLEDPMSLVFPPKVEIINYSNCFETNQPMVQCNDLSQSYYYLMWKLTSLERQVKESNDKVKQIEENERI